MQNKKIVTKQIIILVFVGIATSLFLMAILEDGKLDDRVFGTDKTSLMGIYIADIPVWVEVADTFEKRRTGLSETEELEEDRGMLFVFNSPDKYGIWMKDMNFPIDIFWVDEGNRIIDIQIQAEPESFPEIFYPRANALYVIETAEGFTRMHNINIGDKVILNIL